MNTNNYNKIAEVIRLTENNSNRTRALELADYFQKESEKEKAIFNDKLESVGEFNRQQFLKDCGVN